MDFFGLCNPSLGSNGDEATGISNCLFRDLKLESGEEGPALLASQTSKNPNYRSLVLPPKFLTVFASRETRT